MYYFKSNQILFDVNNVHLKENNLPERYLADYILKQIIIIILRFDLSILVNHCEIEHKHKNEIIF